MYVTDSPTRGIWAYDYDAESGSISNKRMFFKLNEDDEGVLDGCTIDTDGNLWAAVHEGSRLLKISPEGKVIGQVKIPAWKATCPCFGGPDLDELFITTAGVGDGEKAPEGSGAHGSLFRVKTAAKGLRSNKFGPF